MAQLSMFKQLLYGTRFKLVTLREETRSKQEIRWMCVSAIVVKSYAWIFYGKLSPSSTMYILTWLKFKYFNRPQLLFNVATIDPVTWGQPCKLIMRRDISPIKGKKGDWFTSNAASVTLWHRSSLRSSKTGHPWRTALTTVLLSWTQSDRFNDSCRE